MEQADLKMEPSLRTFRAVHVEVPEVGVVPSQASRPARARSPLRSSSPDRTRKFFQDKVQEVVRLTRYGQWDFEFSPRAAHTSVPPWGPASAKEVINGILHPHAHSASVGAGDRLQASLYAE